MWLGNLVGAQQPLGGVHTCWQFTEPVFIAAEMLPKIWVCEDNT